MQIKGFDQRVSPEKTALKTAQYEKEQAIMLARDREANDRAFSLSLSQILPIKSVSKSVDRDEDGAQFDVVSLSFGGEADMISAPIHAHKSSTSGFRVDWTDDMQNLLHYRRGEMRALGFRVEEENGADHLIWSGVDGESSWQPLSPFQCRYSVDQLVLLDTRDGEKRLIDLRLRLGRSLSVIPFVSTEASIEINTELLRFSNELSSDRTAEFKYRLGIDTYGDQTFNLVMFKKARELLLTTDAGRAEAEYWDKTFADYHENLVVDMHSKFGNYLHSELTADMLPTDYDRQQFSAARTERESVVAAQKLICIEGSDKMTATLSADIVDNAQDPAFLAELAREHITAKYVKYPPQTSDLPDDMNPAHFWG